MSGHKSLGYRLIATPGLALIRGVEALLDTHISDGAVLDPQVFPWVREVEASWPAIREELDGLLADEVPQFPDLSPEQGRIIEGAPWRTFVLHIYGHRDAANCARCPRTAAMVQSIPGMTTAMFSIFEPGARLIPHRGPFRGVLRYHLALKVPEDAAACGLLVDGHTLRWEEGRSLVFDDTFEHSAWNDSAEPRVVLFVDFLRPLPAPLALMSRGIVRLLRISPFISTIVRRLSAMPVT